MYLSLDAIKKCVIVPDRMYLQGLMCSHSHLHLVIHCTKYIMKIIYFKHIMVKKNVESIAFRFMTR